MPRGSKNHRPSAASLPCTRKGCPRTFKSESGRTNHVQTLHPEFNGHRLPVNPQEVPVILESPTSSVSGGSPMMLPSPPQSPSPAPEQHEPGEYIPRLKRIYHLFINGLSHVSLSLVYVKYMLISFCKVVHAMQMGTISLKEPHHHLKLKKHVMTGLPLRAKTNLKLQISSIAERRCHKAVLTNFSNYGIFHLWTMGVLAHL